MIKKVLIITEDYPETKSINNIIIRVIYNFYYMIYRYILNREINKFSQKSSVTLLTNQIIAPPKDINVNVIYYNEAWGDVNWNNLRKELWQNARSWYKNIPSYKKLFSYKGIFLNDINDIRIALHLSRFVIPYKNLIEKIISELNPNLIITVTLNSPPEMFGYLISKEKSIPFHKINKINIFKITKMIRQVLWKFEEKEIWNKIKSCQSSLITNNIKPDIILTASHELHLKSIKPLLQKFKERNLQAKIATDMRNLNNTLFNYGFKIQDFANFFNYNQRKDLINIYNQFKNITLAETKKVETVKSGYIENYLTRYFREKLSQYMGFSAVYYDCADIFIKKEKPKAVIFISDRGALETSLAKKAKEINIPTFLISPNTVVSLDNTNEYKIADHVFVTGKHIEEELIKIGVGKDKIHIMGDLRFDGLFKNNFDRKTLAEKYKLNVKQKYILMISTYSSTAVPSDEKKSAFQIVNDALKSMKNYKLLIKCHPNEKIETLKSQVKKWKIKGKVVSGNLLEFISISEAIAQTVSMSGFEAIILNKPVFVLNPKGTYEKHIPYIKYKAALGVNNKEELVYYLKKLETDKKFKDDLLNNARKFGEHYIKKVDGKVAERIADYITDKIEFKTS